jgi:hypothetical protein
MFLFRRRECSQDCLRPQVRPGCLPSRAVSLGSHPNPSPQSLNAFLRTSYMFAVLGLPLSIMLFNRAVVNTKAGSTHDVSPGDTDRTSFTHLQPPTTISMTGANMVNGRDRLSKEYYSPVIENSSPSHGQDQAEEAYAMSSITTPTVYSPGSMPYSPTTTPSSVGNSTLGGEGKTIESPKAGPPSQRSLVPAAEPMPERIPSYYATRPAY